MTRRLFPLSDVIVGGASTGYVKGDPVRLPHGVEINLYADEACTTPLDARDLDGDPIAFVTIVGASLPEFYGSDDEAELVYGRAAGASGNGFPIRAVPEIDPAAITTAIAESAPSKWEPEAPYQGPRSDAFILRSSDDGDQTAALTAFFSDPNLAGKRRLIGRATVAGMPVAPADTWLDAAQAVIEQTGNNARSLQLGARSKATGLRIIGKGTDYVPSEGSTAQTKSGVYLPPGSDDVLIEDYYCENMAESGVYAVDAARGKLNGYVFEGVHGRDDGAGGTIVIPANDARSRAFTLYGACTDWSVDGMDVRNASIGGVSSLESSGLSVHHVRGRTIPGQHLLYLQSGDGLTVGDVVGRDIALNVLKVQLSGAAVDSFGMAISDIIGHGGGEYVLYVTHTATDLSTAAKFRAATIKGITGYNVKSVAQLKSLAASTVSGISGHGIIEEGVTLWDCSDLEGDVFSLDGVGWTGVHVRGGGGGANRRIKLRGVSVRNPSDSPLNPQTVVTALLVDDPNLEEFTLDGFDFSAPNGQMNYGFMWVNAGGAVSPTTTRFRNGKIRDYVTGPGRFVAAPASLGEWSGVDIGSGVVTNFPVTTGYTFIGTVGQSLVYAGTAPPTTGTWRKGARVIHPAPDAGAPAQWVATTTGTPGTWKVLSTASA